MSEPSPRECAAAEEPPAPAGPPPRTSDYYCVDENLPVRFNNPAWFRGYGTKEPVSMYRTSNQAYGSRAPTVHEMPKCLMTDCSGAFPRPINSSVPFRFQKVFYPNSSKFSRQLAAGGMFRNNTFNVYMEKSIVTGPDNYITSYDRFNFHPSYNINRPSICD